MATNDISAALDRLYDMYEQHIAAVVDSICRPGCCICCTRNVVVTSLEGRRLMAYLSRNGRLGLLQKVRAESDCARFIPRLTTNRIAGMCAQGLDVPEEAIEPSWGACPFLEDGLCAVYPVRPFGCRCMLSTNPCSGTGYAELDSFTLTANHVFLQTIEHLDATGYTANLTDMVLYLSKRHEDPKSDPAMENLIANISIPVLMIPPEHRRKIQPIIDAIRAIRIDG